MPDVGFLNLFVVALVAFAVPLGLGLAPRLRVPGPVVEILAGVLLGPGVLGWVTADLPVQVLAVVGLAFLLFLAGLEIDVRALHGRPLALALGGFGITLVVVLAVGVAGPAARSGSARCSNGCRTPLQRSASGAAWRSCSGSWRWRRGSASRPSSARSSPGPSSGSLTVTR